MFFDHLMGFDIIKEQDILVNTTSGLMDLFARPEMLLFRRDEL